MLNVQQTIYNVPRTVYYVQCEIGIDKDELRKVKILEIIKFNIWLM